MVLTLQAAQTRTILILDSIFNSKVGYLASLQHQLHYALSFFQFAVEGHHCEYELVLNGQAWLNKLNKG